MSRSLFYCSSLPSSTQVALRRAGYETVDDLSGVSAETLSKELGIDIAGSQALICATQAPKGLPLSQSVASLSRPDLIRCSYLSVNKILGGGLPRGHILEISGPPGSFKESLALDFVRTFAEAKERVIFVDMQGMTSPKAISGVLADVASPYCQELIRYTRFHALPDLLIFIHNLLAELSPTTGLLILNSISFPFQTHPDLPPSRRTALLGIIRQTLLQACVSNNLTIVVTSQMATKMLGADGSAATFDTGARAVMMPQLGPDYLPSGRSYRLVIIPHSRVAGAVRLLSSPSGQCPGDASQENYALEGS
ncbi:hypothetical protein L210DRAFT_966220 [Boletus edulis BED1]|uniref:RecA family profile 1 domain-containing protein n=1 Tax=Boletus edulis BED1 TaxID=1328754 RepID=A0AAD4BRP5_BOLED|nr:hypothetical protein L210DRAFT_966220 [Boletus edulis BED1]